MVPGRKMRHDDDEDDDAASMVSVETIRTMASEDAEFYDSYMRSEGEEETIEEAIEELTEKRSDHRNQHTRQCSIMKGLTFERLHTCIVERRLVSPRFRNCTNTCCSTSPSTASPTRKQCYRGP